MTSDELRIQTLNEALSKAITENIELIVKVKELNQIIQNMKIETDKLIQQVQR